MKNQDMGKKMTNKEVIDQWSESIKDDTEAIKNYIKEEGNEVISIMRNVIKKVFVICPVRLADDAMRFKLEEYMRHLELSGVNVYLPHIDTKQDDPTGGWQICTDNATAINESDEVHIFYDGRSQGIHFDIGVAFALNKKIKLISVNDEMPDAYLEKSEKNKEFPKMLSYWEEIHNKK